MKSAPVSMIVKRAHQLLLALSIFFVAAAVALGQTSPQEPAPDDVLRIDANLVTIPAQVMDRDGRFVINLRKEDFQILEDGVEQDLSFFATVEEPFTILILLHVSGSMYNYLGDLVRAGNAFLSQLRPNDNFIAVSFCDQVQVLADLSRVNSKGMRVMKLRPCGRTTLLYEAVKTALKRMKTIPGRPNYCFLTGSVRKDTLLQRAHCERPRSKKLSFTAYSSVPPSYHLSIV